MENQFHSKPFIPDFQTQNSSAPEMRKKEPSPRLLCPQKQSLHDPPERSVCTARSLNPGHPPLFFVRIFVLDKFILPALSRQRPTAAALYLAVGICFLASCKGRLSFFDFTA